MPMDIIFQGMPIYMLCVDRRFFDTYCARRFWPPFFFLSRAALGSFNPTHAWAAISFPREQQQASIQGLGSDHSERRCACLGLDVVGHARGSLQHGRLIVNRLYFIDCIGRVDRAAHRIVTDERAHVHGAFFWRARHLRIYRRVIFYLLLLTETPAAHEESPAHGVSESNVSSKECVCAPPVMVLLRIAAAPS
jgi:hypothetical protein